MNAALQTLKALVAAHPIREWVGAVARDQRGRRRRWYEKRVNVEKNQRRQLKRAIGARQLRRLERAARRGG